MSLVSLQKEDWHGIGWTDTKWAWYGREAK
jgi:hypothetical protein